MGFKLKSGNNTPFKMMGSSPVEQTRKAYEFSFPGDKRKVEGSSEKTPDKKTPDKKIDKPKGGKGNDPYAKAAKKDPLLGEYVARRKTLEKGSDEWKRNQNMINEAYGVKKRYEVTEYIGESEPVQETYIPPKTVDKKVVEEVKPQTYTRSQRRAKRKELKGKGFSRKERRAVVQSMRAETALAEGKGKKAKRIAKRVNRKIANKKTRSASDKYLGPTSDRMIDLGL